MIGNPEKQYTHTHRADDSVIYMVVKTWNGILQEVKYMVMGGN